MYVNCLPLYDPPRESFPTDKHAVSPPLARASSNSWKPFRKAKSLSSVAINEIELSDEEKATRSDDEEIQDRNPKRKRSRFGTNSSAPFFSIKVHTRDYADSNMLEDNVFKEEENPKFPLSDEIDATERTDQLNKQVVEATSCNGIHSDNCQDSGDSTKQARGMSEPEEDTELSDCRDSGNNAEQARGTREPEEGPELSPLESGDAVMRKYSTVRHRASSTGSMAEVDDRSDSEEPKGGLLEVNYCSTTLPRLKRSSGSVSFPQRINTSTDTIKPGEVPQTGSRNTNEETDSSTSKYQSPNHKFNIDTEKPLVATTKDETTSTANGISHETDPAIAAIPNPLTPTLLPHWPTTIDQVYLQRSGWLNKLSHRKGVFGDKWQKRYFVLHRSWVYYFKKYGVSIFLSLFLSIRQLI